ncbi:unnamed protein product [Parajaminaea phylloscopi]
MSRGGRGGGRGGGPGGRNSNLPMGSLTYADLKESISADRANAEHLYPYMPNLPNPQAPTDAEGRAAELQLQLMDSMRRSPYWPLATERKARDLPRYTDRYRPEEQDPPSMRNVIMDEKMFPREAWRTYMQVETKKEDLRAARKKRKMAFLQGQHASFDWDAFEASKTDDAAGGGGGAGAEGGAGGADDAGNLSQEEDPEEALGAYEDEEDDDYAQNYFDNGEGDDMDDDGGGGEAYD